MKNNLKNLFFASLVSLIPTILIWIPFFLRIQTFWSIPLPTQGLATIVANYDGPLYIVAAKTLYNKDAIKTEFQFPLPAEYYTAHFPLFPAAIRLFGLVTNYPYAMLIVTLISSIIAIYYFQKLISQYIDKKNVWFMTLLFAVFPARWLIVRSTGSADPLFVAAIIASLYYFKNKKIFWAGVWGAIAQFTKSPGILLFISYGIYALIRSDLIKNIRQKGLTFSELKKYWAIFLIPIALIATFVLYYYRTGDFFVYFHSGDNIHLFFPPFQIFNYSAPWVGTFWLEEIIFIYLIGAVGVYKLFEKKDYEIAIFSAVFYFVTLFIAHRDLLRYFLPLIPFLYVAFSDILVKKEFKFAFIVIIIPIYLFSLAFISNNIMPISNWAPFL